MNINIKGLNISYYEAGEGKTVLLLHGWGANKESLAPLFKALEGSFHVVAPDLPGCGASDEPKSPWSVSDYSEFIKEFTEKKELIPFAAIGHSNGGRVLIRTCSDWMAPEKLILIDSAGIKARHKMSYYIKVYSYKIGKKILKSRPLKSSGLYEKLLSKAGSEDYKNSTPVMRATMSLLLGEDLKERLPLIKAETLLIWGSEDTATPIEDGRTMEKLIPGSGLAEIKGAGHFSYLDNPGAAIGAIKYFLEN